MRIIQCLFILSAFYEIAYSQTKATTGLVKILNGSFEGEPKCCVAPDGWIDCGYRTETPPDVQPAKNINGEPAFGVTKEAQLGSTYLGMVVRQNGTNERLSQKLVQSLLEGNTYTFSIYLCRSDIYRSGSNSEPNILKDYVTPVILRVWGGIAYCSQEELLAYTKPILNTEWIKFEFKIKPQEELTYLELEVYFDTAQKEFYNGNLLLDNMSDLICTNCRN